MNLRDLFLFLFLFFQEIPLITAVPTQRFQCCQSTIFRISFLVLKKECAAV